jgi:hypothetical protein
MKMKITNGITLILLMAIIFSGCGGAEEEQWNINEPGTKKGEVQEIETLFDEGEFKEAGDVELLKELRLCDAFQKDTNNYLRPACSPKFFRVFALNDNLPTKDAFMVLVKSKVGGIKLRRLLLFVREKGTLVKVNGFVANLVGIKKTPSHYYDLVLRFNDNIEGEIIFYNCIFSWDGMKYQFKSAETIDGETWRQRILPQFKDSVSKEIYKTIEKNKMIL